MNRIFYLACFGLVTGVLWRSFWRVDFYTAILIGLISVFLILFSILISKNNWSIFVVVFAFAFSFGIWRFNLADKPAPEIFENQVGQKISLSGIIISAPEEKDDGLKFIVATKEKGEKTKILLSLNNGSDNYKYGDEINFTEKLKKPKNFLTDQNKEFDYINYLRKDGIFYTMQNPKINILSRGHGNFIKRSLFSAKEKFDAKIASFIPSPESILMGGLILGERSSFSESLRQAFINTGTIHIVTISGYNISLVAEWIMKIFVFLPINFAISAGIFSIFIYVIITGGAQTAIRAGIMAGFALLARVTGRNYDIARALALTAVVMIIMNPFILVYDISFELSFLATIAVIFLSPKIEKYFYWLKWQWLRAIVSVTFSAYIFVLPFILYKMGSLSLVALPANIAILPFVPITMILGFITGFAGFVSNFLAFIPGKIAYVLLHYELVSIGFFSHFSFASLSIYNFPFFLVILIYAIFFYNLFGKNNSEEKKISAFHFSGIRFLLLISPVLLTLFASGFLYYRHYESNQSAKYQMQTLLDNNPAAQPLLAFVADTITKSSNCKVKGPLPDHSCTPGAIFKNATVEQICVPGYTKTVRNVSTKLRQKVYAEYGIAYPQPRGAYEVDHLIPLALGGSNDIANLFPEAAEPILGFHEKDIVEVYLQQEVCARRVSLPIAQRQIALDWTVVYNNLTQEEILAIKKKYGRR